MLVVPFSQVLIWEGASWYLRAKSGKLRCSEMASTATLNLNSELNLRRFILHGRIITKSCSLVQNIGGTSQEVASRYQTFMEDHEVIEFEDILIYSYRIIKSRTFVSKSLASLFLEITVDEFQDTDSFQYEILKEIYGAGICKFVFVGDEKQRIFGFAGAIEDAFSKAQEDFAATVHELSTVYRSTDAIVACYSKLFDGHVLLENRSLTKGLNDYSVEFFETKNLNYSSLLLGVLRNLVGAGYNLQEIAILSNSWFDAFTTSKVIRGQFEVCGQGSLPHKNSGDSGYQLFRTIIKYIHRPNRFYAIE